MSHVLHRSTRQKFDIAVRGEGVTITLADGRTVIDASGGAALPGRQAGSGQSAASSHPAGFQSSAVSRPRGGCG